MPKSIQTFLLSMPIIANTAQQIVLAARGKITHNVNHTNRTLCAMSKTLKEALAEPLKEYLQWCADYVSEMAKKDNMVGFLLGYEGSSEHLIRLWVKRYYDYHGEIDAWKIPVNFEGCACGSGEYLGTRWRSHCHRINTHIKHKDGKFYLCGCEYAGVHYDGDEKVALALAERIKQQYMCDCEVRPAKFSDDPGSGFFHEDEV